MSFLPEHDDDLSGAEKNRFARHLMLPEVGETGQKKLRNARVLMIGMGGLGAPAALYLAAAGVGTLGLIDADMVDLSNLQRQIIYVADDVGHQKVEAARVRLLALNPHINVVAHAAKLTAANAMDLIADYDVVLDGTDNFNAHYLANDACVLAKKPLVYGNVLRFDGQIGTVLPGQGPCYRCLYPEAPPPGVAPSCADAGVLGVVPGIIGTMQALAVLNLILGLGRAAQDHVLRFDARAMSFREIKVRRDAHCAVCGDTPTIARLVDAAEEPVCAIADEVGPDELRTAMQSAQPPYLLDVRNADEYDARHLGGAVLIPLPVLEQRLGEIDRAREIVVYCHSGMRSARALQLLQAHGFARVRHLRGGIMAMQHEAA